MKNARIQPLILITCIFVAFIIGLFAGRTLNRTPVQIQSLPAATTPPVTVAMETVPTDPPIVNINTATIAQLQELPNIGPVLAERIIAYRSEHGAFHSVSELVNVPGIGEKKLETIWDLVTTGGLEYENSGCR